jgi:alpha-tubulin suppressor-like RCC1 family protein
VRRGPGLPQRERTGGDGNTTNSKVPVKVKLPKSAKIKAIAPGGWLALTSSGSLLAWGYNFFGQLGDGTTTDSDLPVKVELPPATKATAVFSGPLGDQSLALAHG